MDFFNLLGDLTSPLGAKYCDFYYYLLLISILAIFVHGLGMIMSLFSKDKMKSHEKMNTLMVLISLIIQYFIARLTYSICIKALK